jgi:hypothetical protein
MKEYAQFADAWKAGNQNLPEITHAQEFMAARKSQSRHSN